MTQQCEQLATIHRHKGSKFKKYKKWTEGITEASVFEVSF